MRKARKVQFTLKLITVLCMLALVAIINFIEQGGNLVLASLLIGADAIILDFTMHNIMR